MPGAATSSEYRRLRTNALESHGKQDRLPMGPRPDNVRFRDGPGQQATPKEIRLETRPESAGYRDPIRTVSGTRRRGVGAAGDFMILPTVTLPNIGPQAPSKTNWPASSGPPGLSVAEIADLIGVSRGKLYRAWPPGAARTTGEDSVP